MKVKKRLGIVLGLIVLIFITILGLFMLKRNSIVFTSDLVEIEINTEFHADDYIKEVKGYDKSDITIDTSQLDIDKLGDYEVYYLVEKDKYVLNVKVVDTQAPTFETVDLDVDLGTKITAEEMIRNIQDSTQTKTYFKEEYDFSKAGDYEVVIVVEDEAGNKTEKSAHVVIVKDEEKPTLSGLSDINVYKDGKVDYLKGVTAKDNRDKKPTITVDDSQVKLGTVGTYIVKYVVKDYSGNQADYTRKVIVKEKPVTTSGKKPSSIPADGSKIVYLTFDDGPSANTAKVLDVLNKYNAKATFFVTGNSQKYNYLIKRAHNEGHTIGLHTYCHDYAKVYASTDAYFKDLTAIGNMVKEQIGFVPKYMRFPGGSSNTVSAKYCKGIMSVLVNEVQNRGYQYYDWNVSSGDASGKNGPVPVSKIVKASTSSNANNIMLLMHDTGAKGTTVEALPQIIEHYQTKGYVFKGIDDSSFTPHHGVNN